MEPLIPSSLSHLIIGVCISFGRVGLSMFVEMESVLNFLYSSPVGSTPDRKLLAELCMRIRKSRLAFFSFFFCGSGFLQSFKWVEIVRRMV